MCLFDSSQKKEASLFTKPQMKETEKNVLKALQTLLTTCNNITH